MPFADELLGTAAADGLVAAVAGAVPDSPLTALRAAPARLDGLTLRERADLLRDALLVDVPGVYTELARVVRAATPAFHGWMIWPVTAAIASKAVTDGAEAAFDDAMTIMAELTGVLTAEFAIRVLLRHDLDRALATMLGWTESGDADVRRLASEGSRPYLPWSVRVPEILARPGTTMPILDALYRDPSEYVRRSVANHLNDLSRDHPDLVVEAATRWLADPAATTLPTVRHGLRTLIKRGNPGALALLGFSADHQTLRISGLTLDRTVVALGEAVEFRSTIGNDGATPARLAIDYVVHHRKANGSRTTKTFKLTTATINPGDTISVRRKHEFRVITTRRYHPGAHAIALLVNGVATPLAEFELTTDD
ncbi:DNA alkylation repair protein [Actinoplanes derwentensis]|uniref:3-methyladenine DNA glycosylase AlkC n=1 Tax=Actinoplanes derwentensis TaxID=113562 RepID=A0A1H1U5H6_9ACTN|nr:DNA alkylation repair protein [Actinoplanes derwentensis]SDS67845.1 3-methyladenine DNA glycosylase AlkC [Actinoplanes derwentensis]